MLVIDVRLPEMLINLALIFEFELPVGLFGGNEIKGWVIKGERQDLIIGAQVMEIHKNSCGHQVRQCSRQLNAMQCPQS